MALFTYYEIRWSNINHVLIYLQNYITKGKKETQNFQVWSQQDSCSKSSRWSIPRPNIVSPVNGRHVGLTLSKMEEKKQLVNKIP